MILVQQSQLPVTHLNLYFTQPDLAKISSKQVALSTIAQRQILRGTKRRSRAQLMEAFGLLGANVTLTQRHFAHSVSITTLSRSWKPLMELMTEVFTEPKGCLEELEQSKRAYQAELAARYDMDAVLAWQWLTRRIAQEHPILWAGSSVTAQDIEQVTATDVANIWPILFDQRRLLPCISSNMNQEEMIEPLNLLSETLAQTQSRLTQETTIHKNILHQEVKPTLIEPLKPLSHTTLSLVHKAERQQAHVLMAQPTISPHHPDHLALSLAVCALGGTFSSPLMQEVRVKRGLSYGAQAGLRGEGSARYLTLHATPEAQDATETLKVMHQVLARVSQGELSDEEIDFARSYLINAHPFNIETAAMRATLKARAVLQGLDPEEILNTPARLAQLSFQQVREAATRYLNPSSLEILVLGDHQTTPLSSLAEDLKTNWDLKRVIQLNALDTPESIL